MKSLALILIALMMLTVACTTRNVQQTTQSQETTQVQQTQNDLTAGLVIEEPQDPGMLDDTEVSDSIPQ